MGKLSAAHSDFDLRSALLWFARTSTKYLRFCDRLHGTAYARDYDGIAAPTPDARLTAAAHPEVKGRIQFPEGTSITSSIHSGSLYVMKCATSRAVAFIAALLKQRHLKLQHKKYEYLCKEIGLLFLGFHFCLVDEVHHVVQ